MLGAKKKHVIAGVTIARGDERCRTLFRPLAGSSVEQQALSKSDIVSRGVGRLLVVIAVWALQEQ